MYKNFEFFKNPIKVVAHRGDSKYYPENSNVSFKSAEELGVDMIETDVHISSDGVIFVWHDENTLQLDGNTQNVSNRTWNDLSQLDLGFLFVDKQGKRPFSSKNIKLMTFDEVLRDFPNVRFNVDLKDKNIDIVKGMVGLLKKYNAFDRVIVASFHSENLRNIRKISDKVVTSYGHSEVLIRVILLKLNLFRFASNFLHRAPVIQVPVSTKTFRIVTKTFIKILHKRGIKIQVWTINEADEMRELLKLGVDGVMTDDPRLLLSVIENP